MGAGARAGERSASLASVMASIRVPGEDALEDAASEGEGRMAAEDTLRRGAAGFEGDITGLGLSDIIQLDVVNRFSGCIDVQYEDREGLIFLRDGDVVHAEQGATSGEAAFYEIVSWPGGHFSHKENVATTRRTIQKSCQFLLLEAHRIMDEERVGRGVPPPSPPAAAAPPAPRPTSAAAVLEVLRAVPGVLQAAIQGKDGSRLGDESYEGEIIAGQAQYVAMVGRLLGEKLQAGPPHCVVVQGESRHVILFVAKNHLVTVLVDAAAQVGAVEGAVRKALAHGR
jgi:predicted regulator of Ras-like GTPase activity (Roadblock/LC7/MglB family)